jgi:hypothetical protein
MAEAAKPNSTVDMAEYLWQVKMPVLQLWVKVSNLQRGSKAGH